MDLPGPVRWQANEAVNPVALLSSYWPPPLTHNAERYLLCKRIGREQSSACTSYCASKRPARSSTRYPPRSSSKKPPRLGAI